MRFGSGGCVDVLSFRDVRLRPARKVDQHAWEQVRRRNRDWCGPWDPTPPPGSADGPRTYVDMVRSLKRLARLGEALPWFVWYRPEPGDYCLAGQVTVSNIVLGSARSASVGYWIDQQWAGRGIMPTAVALASDYCFDQLGLHRVEISIRPENGRSLRVVAKLGFRYEGRRERYLHIDGDWRDHDVFVMTSEERPEGGVLSRYMAQRETPATPASAM